MTHPSLLSRALMVPVLKIMFYTFVFDILPVASYVLTQWNVLLLHSSPPPGLFTLASCPPATRLPLLNISKSRSPTCAKLRSACLLLSASLPLPQHVLSPADIKDAASPLGVWSPVFLNVCVCVCSLPQASWEKRVLKSLNSMSTELGVPLARMVAQILYNINCILNLYSNASVAIDWSSVLLCVSTLLRCDIFNLCFARWDPLFPAHSPEARSGAEGAEQQMERDGHGWTRSADVTQRFGPEQSAFYERLVLMRLCAGASVRRCCI